MISARRRCGFPAKQRAAYNQTMEKYHFGIVISGADEMPSALASVALRAQLPELFPEYGFHFFEPKDLQMLTPEKANKLLFRVLGAVARIEGDQIADPASSEALEKIQAAVNRIIAAARATKLN
jgi:hypothetical protein